MYLLSDAIWRPNKKLKNMKELYRFCRANAVCLFLFLMAPSLLFAQKRTLTAHPNIAVDQFINGFYTSLPASYGTGTKHYPLLVFLHGIGEIGVGSATSLPVLLNIGPQKQINLMLTQGLNANFPDPVVVDGKSFEFIVVAPQLNTWPYNGQEQLAVNDMINYAIRNYRVDTSKMYLTGMSMGGGIAWEYPGYSGPLYAKRLAGLIPVAGASSPSSQRAAEIAREHLPVWATHNQSDPTVPTSYTTDYIQLLKDAGANPAPLMTIFPATGHGGWRQTYGDVGLPGCTNSAGQNIYQWMLQYRRVGDNVVLESTTTTPPPTVSAGSGQTITLPTNSVTLSGSASQSGGTITGYKWTEVSGPSTATIGNASGASTTVSGLVQGSYTFQLTVNSSAGLSASSQVKVTVNAAAAPPPAGVFSVSAGGNVTVVLPMNSIQLKGVATVSNELVASCKWTQVSGPSTATISGGGSITPVVSNLIQGNYVFQVALTSQSGIHVASQMTLTVNPLTTGTFVVYAGPDVTIVLPTNSWKIAGVAVVKGETPASCKWVEISGPSKATIGMPGSITPTVSSLIAGSYIFEVNLVSKTGLTSSSRMTLTVLATAARAATEGEVSGLDANLNVSSSTIKLYPNPVPVGQELAVEGQGWPTGTIKFTVYDMTGRVMKQVTLDNQASYFRQTIQVTGLAKGAYGLSVSAGSEKPRTFTFIVR
jgi:predicted esterase